jgi:hypothetical protein
MENKKKELKFGPIRRKIKKKIKGNWPNPLSPIYLINNRILKIKSK